VQCMRAPEQFPEKCAMLRVTARDSTAETFSTPIPFAFSRPAFPTAAALAARLVALVGTGSSAIPLEHAALYLYREREYHWSPLQDSLVKKSGKGKAAVVAPPELELFDDATVIAIKDRRFPDDRMQSPYDAWMLSNASASKSGKHTSKAAQKRAGKGAEESDLLIFVDD
jgi:hypothetical protein